jgi:hypothetical protein
MTTDIASRLGATLIGAVVQSPANARFVARDGRPSVARRLLKSLFETPGHLIAWLNRRQAARDALVRYAMSEGMKTGLGRSEIERAVLLTGRADMLFPSYFINADRR